MATGIVVYGFSANISRSVENATKQIFFPDQVQVPQDSLKVFRFTSEYQLKTKRDPINITISCHKPGENILEKMCEVAAKSNDVRPSICFVDLEQKDEVIQIFKKKYNIDNFFDVDKLS